MRFSIILTSYNQRTLVAEALQSVLGKTTASLELLCMDDGSTDGSAEQMDEFAKHDPRVRVVRLTHSGRPGVSRNRGLELARGEYICFLDGDDLYHPARLDRLQHAVDASDPVDVIFHDYADFADGTDPVRSPARITGSAAQRLAGFRRAPLAGLPTAHWMASDGLALSQLADGFLLYTGSICIRRGLIEARRLRFPEDRVYGEDNIVWLRALVDARVLYLDETLVYWRKHAASLTSTRRPQAQADLVASMHEMFALLAARFPEADLRKARARIVEESLEVGWLLWKDGHSAAAIRSYWHTAVRLRAPEGVRRIARALAAMMLGRRPTQPAA